MVLDFQGVGISSGGAALWAGVVSELAQCTGRLRHLLIMTQDMYLGRIYNLCDCGSRNLPETPAAKVLQ